MKILSILISLVFSLNAISAAPYGFKGQNQTATQYSNVLQFPNGQVTKLAGINSLVETGNKNILVNPDFEHSTFNTSWTNVTVTPVVETTDRMSGKKSTLMAPSAQTFEYYQDSTLYAASFQGSTQLLAMVWVRTNQSGIKVCSRNDGVTSTTNCVTVAPQSPSVWQLIKVPFISSSTSNGISIAASSSITGNVYIDDAFVGAVDLKTDSVQVATQSTQYFSNTSGTNILTGTPTNSGVNTNYSFSAGTFTALRDINVTISCTSRATSAPSSQISPYINGVAVQVSNTRDAASFSASATASAIVRAGQTFYCKVDAGSNDSGYVSVTATNIVNAQIYSTSCGANCVDNFSFDASTTGVVTADDLDFVNGNASSIANTSEYTYTFNSGKLTATPSCEVTAVSNGAVEINAQIMTVSSSAITVRLARTSDEVNTVSAHTIFCKKTGADFVASRIIVGSFAEVVTTPTVQKPFIGSAYITGSGCTLTRQRPSNWLSINSSGSVCVFNILNSQSVPPDCTFTPINDGNNVSLTVTGANDTTSLITATKRSNGTVTAAIDFRLVCHGSLN